MEQAVRRIKSHDKWMRRTDSGSKPKVSVTLENEVGEQKYVFVEDECLIENHLDEESVWTEEF